MPRVRGYRVLLRKAYILGANVRAGWIILRREGPAAAWRFATGILPSFFRRKTGGPSPRAGSPLDEEYGTDTAEGAKLYNLEICGSNYVYANYYRPTEQDVLDAVFAHLPIAHDRFTFIDFGSGKGLVVFRAAAYPFKKAIGVEFARELHETAERNLSLIPRHTLRSDVELVLGDALEYVPPDGGLVLYFYQPFGPPLMRRMIARVKEWCVNREVFVICAWTTNPAITVRHLWEEQSFLATLHEGAGWTIYRTAGLR